MNSKFFTSFSFHSSLLFSMQLGNSCAACWSCRQKGSKLSIRLTEFLYKECVYIKVNTTEKLLRWWHFIWAIIQWLELVKFSLENCKLDLSVHFGIISLILYALNTTKLKINKNKYLITHSGHTKTKQLEKCSLIPKSHFPYHHI